MCQVAGEARIFPLLKSYGGPSPHLEIVVGTLWKYGYEAKIKDVSHEFQHGSDKMLDVAKPG